MARSSDTRQSRVTQHTVSVYGEGHMTGLSKWDHVWTGHVSGMSFAKLGQHVMTKFEVSPQLIVLKFCVDVEDTSRVRGETYYLFVKKLFRGLLSHNSPFPTNEVVSHRITLNNVFLSVCYGWRLPQLWKWRPSFIIPTMITFKFVRTQNRLGGISTVFFPRSINCRLERIGRY
jgi:hypothetical protein